MDDQWYYRMLGEEFGPVSEADLHELVTNGTLGSSDEVRRTSQTDWQTVATLDQPDGCGDDNDSEDASSLDLDSMLASPTGTPPTSSNTDDPASTDLDAMLAPSSPGRQRKVDANTWYYRIGGKRLGPFDFDTLFEHATSGRFSRYDEIRAPGADDWVEAQTIVGLFPDEAVDLDSMLVEEAPMPAAQAHAPAPKQLWHYRVLNQEMGPVDFEGLFDLVVEGNLRSDDDIRGTHETEWRRADSLVGLFPDDLNAAAETDPAADFDMSEEAAEDAEWYFKMDDQELGPVTFERLVQLAEKGRLDRNDQIRLTKLGSWMQADSMVGLFPEEPPPEKPPAPAAKPASNVPERPSGDADDWAAAVLSEPAAEQRAALEPETPRPTQAATPAASAPSMPAGGLGGATPAQRPSFTPPPKPKRSSSSGGGGFSLPSGLGETFANPKLWGGIGVAALLVGLFFIPWGEMLGPGAEDLITQIDEIWTQVKGLYEKEAPDSEWTALASKVGPELEEIAQESKDRGAGGSRPALQITLVLSSTHIPKILDEKMASSQTKIKTVDNFLARAKEVQ